MVGGFRWCGDPRIAIFPEGRDFAPRGLRDCLRAKPKGNLEGRGVQKSCTREISDLKRYVLVFCGCGALLQSAMGTKFRSKCGPNGDPILSEMGA